MDDETQIKEVINSIDTYCLGDIRHNKSKPIAAFILCLCCIDVLGALRYNKWKSSKRWEVFVSDYMPIYSGLGIYKKCRNDIVHSYTSNKKYAVTNDLTFTKPHDIGNDGRLIINTTIFIENIEKAFEKFKEELLTLKSETRKNSLNWDNKFPLLRDKTI